MKRLHRSKVLGWVVASGCLAVILASPVAADADQGKDLYVQYCSACHGASGKGDGVVSQSMRPHPNDLTQLAKDSGGTFQAADIAGKIDGRETVRAHGNADMPVWGEQLRQTGGSFKAPNEVATNRVLLIVEYLKTIQAK